MSAVRLLAFDTTGFFNVECQRRLPIKMWVMVQRFFMVVNLVEFPSGIRHYCLLNIENAILLKKRC